MSPELERLACARHPGRDGAARCVTCKQVVCQECATRWDGINYCVACLVARRGSDVASSSVLDWLAWTTATALLAFVVVRLMAWAGAVLAGALSS